MNVLMPCAGLYKRFPNNGLPKYVRPMNDMRPMFIWSLESFKEIFPISKIFFAVREKDEKDWEVSKIIKDFLPESKVLIIKKNTDGPAHTVKIMIEEFGINEPFVVKDCDCQFYPKNWLKENGIFVAWRETAVGDRGTKSWIDLKDERVSLIEEKKSPKDWYCCGGYQFIDPINFKKTYEVINRNLEEVFCSHIIQYMIDNKIEFHGFFCENPVDWGSWEKYIIERRKNKILFFDFDGVIVEAGAPYGKNKWADSKVIPGAKEKIIELKQKGHSIIILTSRTSKVLKDTISILDSNNIPYDRIITDIPNGQRVLINDYAPSNPYPTAESVNTRRNTLDWVNML